MTDKEVSEKEYLNATNAALYLGTSRAGISRLIKAGKLKYAKKGIDTRNKWIKKSDLDELKKIGVEE